MNFYMCLCFIIYIYMYMFRIDPPLFYVCLSLVICTKEEYERVRFILLKRTILSALNNYDHLCNSEMKSSTDVGGIFDFYVYYTIKRSFFIVCHIKATFINIWIIKCY
jgi:hypothetical protein